MYLGKICFIINVDVGKTGFIYILRQYGIAANFGITPNLIIDLNKKVN